MFKVWPYFTNPSLIKVVPMEAQKDNRSEIMKKMDKVVGEALMDLVHASDNGEYVTPFLISKVHAKVAKLMEQVHYGFHPDL